MSHESAVRQGPLRTRGVVFAAPRTVRVEEATLPELGDGEVLIATLYSGISAGTELLAYRGEVDAATPLDETLGTLAGTFSYPFRYGYSCVGRVVRSRGRVREGQLVFAFHPHQAHLVLPAADVIPVDGVSPRIATLFPLVETALQASLDAGCQPHETVAVMGLGVIGTLTAALLVRSGADVVAADPRPWRRVAAQAFGVDAIHPDDLAAIVQHRTEGAGAPLVVDATGDPEALAGGLQLLAFEGTALVLSWYGNKPVSLPLGEAFHRRRLVVRSSQVSTIPAALRSRWTVARRRAVTRRLLEELPMAALATHDFALEEAAAAFEALDRGVDGLVHAALAYG